MTGKEDAVDPLLRWRLDDMAAYYPPAAGREYWSVRVDFTGPATFLPDTDEAKHALAGAEAGSLVVPPLYDAPATREAGATEEDDDAPHAVGMTVYADRAAIERLLAQLPDADAADGERRSGISAVTVGRRITGDLGGSDLAGPARGPAAETARRPAPETDDGPPAVIVAVIDDGIALGHELFRDAQGGTRIEHAWIMADRDGNRGAPGTRRGRELTKAAIDAALTANAAGGDPRTGALDEAGFQRDLGILDFAGDVHHETAFRRAHGTHVLSLAAGRPPATDDGRLPIIAVQLPATVTEATGGDELLPDLALAIDFILEKARDVDRLCGRQRLPLVLNFSYGNFAGAHDGTDPIARLLTRLATWHRREIRVVVPAGNGNLAQAHAVVAFCPGETGSCAPDTAVEIGWRVQPDDKTASFLHFWLPARPTADATRQVLSAARVTTPDGQTVTLALGPPPGPRAVDLVRDGQVFGRLALHHVGGATGRGRLSLMIKPTAHEEAHPDLAPHGLWRIALWPGDIAPDEVVHARIQRDDSLPNYPLRGRQSFFEDSAYVRFDAVGRPLAVDPTNPASPIRREGTLSPFATGDAPDGVIVAGGWVRRSGEMAPYSSGGPASAPSTRGGPDAALVAEDSLVLGGVIGAGSQSGSLVAMNGTSVAAPQLARWIALRLLVGMPTDRQAVGQEAAVQEAGFPQAAAPPPEWRGAGRMDVAVFPDLPRRLGPDDG